MVVSQNLCPKIGGPSVGPVPLDTGWLIPKLSIPQSIPDFGSLVCWVFQPDFDNLRVRTCSPSGLYLRLIDSKGTMVELWA